jgi:hypothetical protein
MIVRLGFSLLAALMVMGCAPRTSDPLQMPNAPIQTVQTSDAALALARKFCPYVQAELGFSSRLEAHLENGDWIVSPMHDGKPDCGDEYRKSHGMSDRRVDGATVSATTGRVACTACVVISDTLKVRWPSGDSQNQK